MKRLYKRVRNKLIGKLAVLKENGLTVGDNFNMKGGVVIDSCFTHLITIGDNVTLAPKVHILSHDASTKIFLGVTKTGNVSIGNKVFIGTSTTILPCVKIGSNVIVAANSLVCKDIPSNEVWGGNPAKLILTMDDFISKRKAEIESQSDQSEYKYIK